MPRPERPLPSGDDQVVLFAADLRTMRANAGAPGYRELGRRAHYSAAALSEAAAGRKLPTLPLTLAYVRACGGDVAEWEARWHVLARQQAESDTETRASDDGCECPYPGLAGFGPDDAARFFGRERLTQDLLDMVESNRLVLVFGASGSGKSSLLRAGLTPRLNSRSVVFSPGTRPLEECAIAIARLTGLPVGDIHDQLTSDPRNLHRVLRQGDADCVLVIDQFEDVFALCHDQEERDRFIEALLYATSADRSCTRVVFGVRADFYGHCTRYPQLVAALRTAQLPVGPMAADELRRAITQPAWSVSNGVVEGDLLAVLIDECSGESAALPLLAHVLRETWQHRRGNTLTLAGYWAVGGIDGALARTAEACYASLTRKQQHAARRLFLRLTAIGDGTQDIKRRIHRAELSTDDASNTEILSVLATARLITVDSDTVEITHESLLRAWPRLSEWLTEDRAGRIVHRELTEAALAWDAYNRDPCMLYTGSRLMTAHEWATANNAALNSSEQQFLNRSVAAHSRATHRRRGVMAVLVVSTLLAVAGGAGAYLQNLKLAEQSNIAMARSAMAYAASLRGTQPGLARQLSLAAYRLHPATGTPAVFDSLGTPAVFGDGQQLTDVAYSPTQPVIALSTTQETRLWHTSGQPLGRIRDIFGGPASLSFSHDGTILTIAGAEPQPSGDIPDPPGVVHLWDVHDPADPQRLASVRIAAGVHSAAINPDKQLLAVATHSAGVALIDIQQPLTPGPARHLTGPSRTVASVSFNPTGPTLAGASPDGTLVLWDSNAPDQPPQVLRKNIPDAEPMSLTAAQHLVAFAHSGTQLAAAGPDGTVHRWDLSNAASLPEVRADGAEPCRATSVTFSAGDRALAASCHSGVTLWDITDAAEPLGPNTLSHSASDGPLVFAPDQNRLLQAADNGALMWNTTTPLAIDAVATLHSGPTTRTNTSIAYSLDGNLLATLTSPIEVWDVSDPQRPHRKLSLPVSPDSGPDTFMTDTKVAFVADDTMLAATDTDGIQLWDITGAHPRPVYRIPEKTGVARLAYNQLTGVLAAAGLTGIRLYSVSRTRPPEPMASLPQSAYDLTFSPDGSLLATAEFSAGVSLWNLTTSPPQPISPGDHATAQHVAISPDGTHLASTSADGTVRLSALSAGGLTGPARVVVAETNEARNTSRGPLAFSADSRLLIVNHRYNSFTPGRNIKDGVDLWDITDPQQPTPRGSLLDSRDTGWTASPTTDIVATVPNGGGRRQRINLWSIAHGDMVNSLCGTVGDPISPDQWRRYIGDEVTYQPPCTP